MNGPMTIYRLTCTTRDYAWGSTTLIPRFLGRPADGRPQAELWVGAHPGAPSRLPDGRALGDLVAAAPEAMLGKAASERFGSRLPFLLKALAAAEPLSLQVHPTSGRAKSGYAEEEAAGIPVDAAERSYRDPFHKPELVVAVTRFEGMAGFRDVDNTARILQLLGTSWAEETARRLTDGPADQALHAVVADLAVVARRATMLTLATHTRPDDVDDVAVSLAGVSPAGRAAALATLRAFYGIGAREWSDETFAVDAAHAVVSEGPAALIPIEDDEIYQEDLGRAWFLMTDTPFVSHVCVARRSLLTRDPVAVAEAVGRLAAALAAGNERGRELRRDLSKRHGIDRDLLVEVLADQEWELTAEGIAGLALLARRAGLTSGANLERAVVRVGRGQAG